MLLGGIAVAAEGGTPVFLAGGDGAARELLRRFGALLGVAMWHTLALVISFVWNFSYTFWPRKPPSS